MNKRIYYRHHLTKALFAEKESVLVAASQDVLARLFEVRKTTVSDSDFWQGPYVAINKANGHRYVGTLRDLKEWIYLHA